MISAARRLTSLISRLRSRWALLIVLGGSALLAVGVSSGKLVRRWQLAAQMATLPIIVLGADGKVRINGEPLVMAGNGAPPELLARLEGAAPDELPVEKWVQDIYTANEDTTVRYLQYPRIGVQLVVLERSVNSLPRVRWLLKLPIQGGKDRLHWNFRGTLEFRGRQWWITDATPPTRSEFRALSRVDDYVPSSPAEKLVGELARIYSRPWQFDDPAGILSLTFDPDGRIQSVWIETDWQQPLPHE